MNSSELLRSAKEYEDMNDPDRAYQYYLEAALDANDGEAVYVLAQKYLDEEIVCEDYFKAAHYFEIAYERGYELPPYIYVLIGSSYVSNGNSGRPDDSVTAMFWFDKAVKSGVKYANACLGELYYMGNGVDSNYKRAYELFKAAGEASLPFYYLGLMYERGDYVEKNIGKAIGYYTKIVEEMPDLKDYGDLHYKLAELRLTDLRKY